MDDNFIIPVIDFSKYSLDIEEENVSSGDIKRLADEICAAFKTVGFVYLKNYGISQTKVLYMSCEFYWVERSLYPCFTVTYSTPDCPGDIDVVTSALHTSKVEL